MGACTNLNVLEFHGCSLLPDIQVFCFAPIFIELLCYIIYWRVRAWLVRVVFLGIFRSGYALKKGFVA